jgi:hypothetical protein
LQDRLLLLTCWLSLAVVVARKTLVALTPVVWVAVVLVGIARQPQHLLR